MRTLKPLLCLVSTLSLTEPALHAATKTWDGGGADDFWATAANWNAAIASGDNLVFGSVAPFLSTNNLAPGFDLGLITFSAGHTIRGNAINLTNGITTSHISGTTVFGLGITNKAPTTFANSRGSLVLSNGLRLNAFASTFDLLGTCIVEGQVSGLTANSRIVKTGNGRLVLDGGAAYSGSTVVNGGTLEVNAGITSPITLTTNAVLAGENSFTSVTSTGGGIRPGGSGGNLTGVMSFSGAMTLDGGTEVAIQLGGTGIGTSDRISANGAINLGNARLNVSFTGGFVPTNGMAFPIIVNGGAGPINGIFAGLPEGALFPVGDVLFQISYTAISGNDVVLTVTNREPSTLVWDGGAANPLWSDALNWEGDVAPFPGDTLIFPGHVPSNERTNQNDFPAGLRVERLVFGGTNWTVNGNAIQLRNGIEATNRVGNSGVTLNLGVTLETNQTWLAGTNSLFVNSAIDLGTNMLTAQVTAGQINLAGSISGAGRVVKRGAGEMTVAGNHQFTGGLQIDSGLVIAAGRHTVGAPWVQLGGQLRVVGTIPGLDANGGTVMIPFLPAENTIAGNLDLAPQVTLDFSFGTATLSVTGTVNLANVRLTGVITNLPQATVGPAELLLIRNDGNDPIVGTFLNLPEGAVILGSAGTSNYLTYAGGDGNDVTLRAMPRVSGAAPRIWDGGGTNDSWTTATNWNPNTLPNAGISVRFPANAARKQHHVNSGEGISRFFIGSMFFDDSGYVISNAPPASALGVIELGGGIFATNTSGTNALSAIVGVWTDQPWRVQSSNAVFRFGGIATGYGGVNKDGAGLMEMTGALLTNQLRYVNRAGPSRFLNTAAERIAVAGGTLDMTSGGALQLAATGGVTRLARTYIASLTATTGQVEFASGPLTGGTTNGACAITNLTLGPGAQVIVEVAATNSTAILLLGPMAISNATLDVRVTGSIRGGDVLTVATPFPAGLAFPFPAPFAAPTNTPAPVVVNGTFAGLPDGAEATFSGRQFRIHYSRTNGPTVLPGVYLTALASTPVLTRIVVLESGVIEIEGNTDPFTQVTLEGSNDFEQWTTLGDAVSKSNGRFQLTDSPGIAVPHRFYRARVP